MILISSSAIEAKKSSIICVPIGPYGKPALSNKCMLWQIRPGKSIDKKKKNSESVGDTKRNDLRALQVHYVSGMFKTSYSPKVCSGMNARYNGTHLWEYMFM